MHIYDTVTAALADLKKRDFTTDFNIAFDKIKCADTDRCFSPSEFEIVEHYRFEGNTDPGEEAVIYAVSSKDESMKGVLVSAYGMYSDSMSDEMIQKLRVQQ